MEIFLIASDPHWTDIYIYVKNILDNIIIENKQKKNFFAYVLSKFSLHKIVCYYIYSYSVVFLQSVLVITSGSSILGAPFPS